MSKKITDLPSLLLPTPSDILLAVDTLDGASKQLTIGDLPVSSTLFKWNETDLSQFDTATPLLTPSAGTAVLGVGAGIEGPTLDIVMTGSKGQALWDMGLSLPRRYSLRARLEAFGGGPSTSDNLVFLLTNGGVGAACYGIQMPLDGAGTFYIIEAGVRITTGTGGTSGGSTKTGETGLVTRLDVTRINDPLAAGAGPRFSFYIELHSKSGLNGDAIGREEFSHTFTAGWDGLSLDRLAFGISTSNAKTGTISVPELAVLKHPLDR